jgi:beta-N-acetylhexosaminidase
MLRERLPRALLVLVALAATAAIYVLVVREDSGGTGEVGRAAGGEVPEEVRSLVESMTPEQKVDGVLMVGFEGADASAPILEELRSRQLGGVIVRGENWVDSVSGSALVKEIERAARAGGSVPPLIAAAQEGGEYRALADLPPEARQLDIGDQGSPEFAEETARETGEAMRDAGLSMNLAPIADVATLDSPIADRAYSDDDGIVALMTAAAVRGCAEAGIACAARHFPGLGAASGSTDDGPATVGLDPAALAARDLAPFEAAVAEDVPAVVLSHAFYVGYDPVTPGSLSPQIVKGLLRDDLGFTGVAITDDLATGAIRATSGVTRAAIDALNAGADMLLVEDPEETAGVRAGLLAAIDSGDVPERRLDEAVGRVLALKLSLGLIE